jgi:HK97 gp10 family phage protein
MADGFQTSISGIEETVESLSQLPTRLVRGVYGKALTAAVLPVVEALEPRIPVEHGDLKEALASDIAIDADGKGGVAQIGFGKEGWKARLVEFGHRMIGHKPERKDLGEVQQHPFMRPAAAVSAEASIDAFSASLKQSVDEGIPGMERIA